MRRACKVTLKFATAKKRRHIAALLEAYKAAVNFYIQSLWNERGKLDKGTLARLKHFRLSARYRSQALKQALETVVATRKSAKALKVQASVPVFNGSAVLDAKFVNIEEGRGSFDLIVCLSGLHSGHRMTIPTRATRVLRKWLNQKDAALIQGCALSEDSLVLWVNIPEYIKTEGEILGIDIGVNKLLVDSNGKEYGTNFKAIRNKIKRRIPGSKGRQRAHRERDNYIGQVLNKVSWSVIRVLGVEDLKNLKLGKRKNRNKSFRKAMAPWIYRRVLERIGHKVQENRIHLVAVPPAYTSQICPVCSLVSKNNRRGENFLCIGCGYKADADHVGAQNVLARTLQLLESVESPRFKKAM